MILVLNVPYKVPLGSLEKIVKNGQSKVAPKILLL